MNHSIFALCGFFFAGLIAEKVSAELYYNSVLLDLADKYNFTPQEVTDLQRNLNEFYI